MIRTYNGDCLEILSKGSENKIDAIICDPPYGIKFMNKRWDDDCPSVEVWKECLRVLKPGGYLLSFSGTRTMDFIMGRIREAGFEVRDTIAWLYGSGFPKSHNISKAIDKKFGAEREIIGRKIRPNGKDHGNPSAGSGLGGAFGLNGHSLAELYEMRSKGITKTKNNRNVASQIERGEKIMVDDRAAQLTTPATDLAKQWDGWGTALKPACEFIVVARKPFKGTVVNNVLEYGTGGLNIDECRVEVTKEDAKKTNRLNHKGNFDWSHKDTTAFKLGQGADISQGRFPANLILDEEAGKMLDEQSGVLKTSAMNSISKESENRAMTGKNYKRICKASASQGGASRFFYCAKAPKSERGINNGHPCVKPQKLMQYLVKLVTPPNGTVLDPFMGSGSTGVAATTLGFDFIGIERNKEYFEIANARLQKNS